MNGPQDKHDQPEQKNEVNVASEQASQNQAARRAMLKAAWVAPVVFSVAAQQAFAASPMGRRR